MFYAVNNEKHQPSLKGTIMFEAILFGTGIFLALCFIYNIDRDLNG